MVWKPSEDGNSSSEILFIVNIIFTAISFIATFWCCYAWLKFEQKDKVPLKYVFLITLSNFLYSLANLISIFDPEEEVTFICSTDAVIRVWSYTFNYYIASCLALYTYLTVTNKRPEYTGNSFFNISIVIGVLFCVWLTIAPLFFPSIAYSNGDLCCDVIVAQADTLGEKAVGFLHTSIPIVILLVITLVAYFLVFRFIRNSHGSRKAFLRPIRRDLSKFIWYPIILFIITIPDLLDVWTMNFDYKPSKVPFLMYLQFALTRSIGFINAIIVGYQLVKKQKGFDNVPESPSMISPDEKSLLLLRREVCE